MRKTWHQKERKKKEKTCHHHILDCFIAAAAAKPSYPTPATFCFCEAELIIRYKLEITCFQLFHHLLTIQRLCTWLRAPLARGRWRSVWDGVKATVQASAGWRGDPWRKPCQNGLPGGWTSHAWAFLVLQWSPGAQRRQPQGKALSLSYFEFLNFLRE